MSLDKLAEAEYFVGLLKSADAESHEFRYLCAASVSAIRSIALVLQKDLKHKVRGFEAWFEQWKKRANSKRFKELTAMRNMFQKEGNEYPQLYFSARIDSGPIAFVHFHYCPADTTRPVRRFDLQLDPHHKVTASAFSRPRLPTTPLSDAEHAFAVDLLGNTAISLSQFSLSGIVVDEDPSAPALHPSVFIQRLEEILDEQRELVMDAMREFRVPTSVAPVPLSDFGAIRVIVPER